LKQVVPRPDVVEMHDVTARDPKLLVHLKSYRNTVPVPRHWCYKRKYLQGKRGIEKAPFDLPAFIKKTGIMEMRAALAEKEETKTLKAKIRERVRPKMGKIDIDYQKLHDAFFKWQSKPKMTIHGDLYYEGKEFETRMKDKKPGELSDDLRTALGMPVGPNSQRVPPPWLIAMQRYGPPPSYPHLKIPGLNAPIPEGCSFGYHAGGWGKPPVDEFGRPLYGDVFGLTGGDASGALEEENIDRTMWGELESEEEVESEEEEEEEEEKEEEAENEEESGLQTPAEGLQTPSGFSSVPAGLETPNMIELRKNRIEQDMEGSDTPALYTVLPEKRVDRISGSMMASTHVYDLSGVKEKVPRGVNIGATGGQEQGRVELILDPSELDLVDNEGTLAARYEQQLKEQQSHLQKEDLSDMVAEHAAKQKSKRKRQMQQQDVKQAKKYKEFKF
jgi:splicing factor 3B subunit 2